MNLLTAIGLGSAPLATPVPNYGPSCLIFHFVWAYGVLSSRTLKQYFGIDHNVSPREDLNKYGEAAVREGKLTQAQLAMLRRNEAAHANAVENFALLVAAISLATFSGVPRTTINRAALTYTFARVSYGFIYIFVDRPLLSQLRGVTWWIGNLSCLTLLWKAGNLLSG
ncbi:hypothetical protein P175DRAFT_0500478 [Aspergillus ochraceoroseus IBT 24754]|uniref:MAPEG family protein n=3 Tax=Aspergillus subgen. Nidulantes TaxID=2720870 RepID=A0A0F8WT26_9EURO|nr:uncharacterized protein P175DRAFT_0500478 [Aspergillus ochraceoroseus IBT 24754]KKK14402.1 hypothetical protein ARAM_000102 [Aspergillus rambellii]KKK25595.1 hypothetical protein AOCH_000084 [Aspergillus ochraceoroseus]PTU21589.1 hypothetical protein P175DRAFT_0500478 [Aspergillus ochraceoroseus IBT 24754]